MLKGRVNETQFQIKAPPTCPASMAKQAMSSSDNTAKDARLGQRWTLDLSLWLQPWVPSTRPSRFSMVNTGKGVSDLKLTHCRLGFCVAQVSLLFSTEIECQPEDGYHRSPWGHCQDDPLRHSSKLIFYAWWDQQGHLRQHKHRSVTHSFSKIYGKQSHES